MLAEALRSDKFSDRLIAVEALANNGQAAALPLLEFALGDPDHDVRLTAVDGLSKLVQFPRARALLASVRDDSAEPLAIRALASAALLPR